MKTTSNYFVFVFCLLIISSCSRDYSTYYVSDQIPVWLLKMITEIENSNYYFGAVIYRHQWHLKSYYHIMIPIESCAYCRVYDANGNKIDWSNESFQDYINNRSDEVIIWKFKSF